MYPHPWKGACLFALNGGETLAVLLKVVQTSLSADIANARRSAPVSQRVLSGQPRV